jgi:hypothetical protein
MLGKQAALDTDIFLPRNSDPKEVRPKQSQQVQYLLDKYMHAENLLVAQSMELKKKDMKFCALEQKCQILTQKICLLESESSQTHSKGIYKQLIHDKQRMEICRTKSLVIEDLSYNSKYRKWLQEKSELHQHIKDITTQNDKLKVIIKGFFKLINGIIGDLQSKEEHSLKCSPQTDIENCKDPYFSPKQLSQMLNDCHTLIFPGTQLESQQPQPKTEETSVQLNTPSLSENPSSIEISKQPSSTVQASQDTGASHLGEAHQFETRFRHLMTPEELMGICFMELHGMD